MVAVSGIGSWPGTDIREALSAVRDLHTDLPSGVDGVPYLPELPARGPGADLVGRGAHLLSALAVDLQPQGWRLVDRPGRDASRTGSLWRQDLDELAEAYVGWSGPLKVQVTGPWTLAAEVWLTLGDRVLSDRGATRDLTASLAEGVAEHVRAVRRLVPEAELVVQLDEPQVAAVLLGRVRSASGYRVLRTPEPPEVIAAVREVLTGARAGGAQCTLLHFCADRPPVGVLRDAGPDALALDISTLGEREWESVATAVEADVRLWAGVVPGTDLLARWREIGLPRSALADLTLTPPCGLAGADPAAARAAVADLVRSAQDLAEAAHA